MSIPERPTLMRGIVKASLRFRFIVVAIAAAMIALGTLQLPHMRVDVFPEFAPPRVEIQTICLGLTTTDVEQLVTVPLEQALTGIKGLEDLRSRSVPQLSAIELDFTQGTDELEARQLVAERLDSVAPTLPTWASPPVMLPPVSATGRTMQIGMTSRTHSVISMSMTAYWTIRARLMQVPGVSNVAIWGERLKMMTVQVRPHQLVRHRVSLDDVMETTSDSVDSGLLRFSSGSVIGTGGVIQGSTQQLGVRHVLPIVTPADLSRVPLQGRPGLRIGDVARVAVAHQPLIGDAVIDDKPGLLLVVEKAPWANTLQLTQGVQRAIDELKPGLPGIKFEPRIFQQARFIETSIHNLRQALLLGFLLVVVILFLFLFEWRVALISLLTIPLSLMATVLVLDWSGATINTMTLAGLVIALGAVVDDAIIDVENILRRLRQNRRASSGRSTAAVILDASLEVRGPIVYATLIIVAAAVPVFLLEGLTGAFFRPLAISYTLAIVASMGVALTVTPALCLILLRNARVERHESPVVRWLQVRYTALLGSILHRPRRAYATFAVIGILGVLVTPQLGQELFPTFKERDFLVHWISTPGTSVAEERRTTIRVGKELEAIPGVRSFGSHIGQAFLGEEIAGVNFGEAWISVSDNADLDQTLARVHKVIDRYPGLYRDVLTYLNERIEEVLTGAKEPIVVRVYGDNLHVIRAKAHEIQQRLAGIPGLVDLHTDLQVDEPQIEVTVKLHKAAQYGLKPGDVRRAASTMIAGEEVGDIFRNGKAYDTVTWSIPSSRNNVTDVQNMLLDTPNGGKVPLWKVADARVRPIPNVIERQGGSRRIDVGANVAGRDLGSVVADVKERLEKVSYPRGYHAELLGEWSERQAAQHRLLSSAILAVVAILLLLQLSFGNWRLAVFSLLTLVMALVGGVLAVRLSGGVVSLGALVGFFTVFGIAARNGILLINHCQHLERVEGQRFGPELVLRGARERLSPILMTSLATGLALVPLVILGDRPGHEIEYPLAVVILGGLVTSTLLNLLVVPSLYLRFGKALRSRRHQSDTPAPA
ncbi:MAG TPA: efflux RND transporter permease subunit [Marmoricola sp.]